jgi:hypothetical protein
LRTATVFSETIGGLLSLPPHGYSKHAMELKFRFRPVVTFFPRSLFFMASLPKTFEWMI